MILCICQGIDKVSRFDSEQAKVDRANTVIQKTSDAVKNNPNLSYNEFKSYLPDGNAVEYKDMRTLGGNVKADTLVGRW